MYRLVISLRGISILIQRTSLARVGMIALICMVVLVLKLWPFTWAYAETPETKQEKTNLGPNAIPRGPTEVPARIEEDTRPKEATFDFPGVDRFLKPWTDWKARVAKEHGFRLGFDYQPVAQWSNNTVGEDFAAGGIFRGFSSWDIWARDNPSRTGTLDVRVENRHRLGTDLPPESLGPNFGWLGTTAPDWSDQGWGLTVFMLRQRPDIGEAPIELDIGRMSSFALFDITPYSDNLTAFQNNSMILSPTIAYPSAGAFGAGGYVGIPKSKFYALGLIQDANGSYDDLSFDSLEEGEFFTAFEFGWTDQGLSSLSYLFNNVHVAIWHSEGRGKGVGLTGSYTFAEQRLGVFARLGWASEDASTAYEKYAAAGVTKSVFRDSMIGLGISWGQPHDNNVDQVATEVFYRWQLSQHLALTPSIQVLFDPALNQEDDVVTVLGLRARVTF
jgi:porin